MTRRKFAAGLGALSASTTIRAQEGSVDSELHQAIDRFIQAIDSGDASAVARIYAPNFANIRVAADGGFSQLTGAQILSILQQAGPANSAIPTRDTVIHHAEVSGNLGFVLMTRVRDLGNGWEPLFYSMIWKKSGPNWLLEREFVNQKSFPKWR